ncbi:hypothetical protein DL95DRAFT_443223 [Leptodontidium sp. 2 PMI_412]|nr:hypothetical protein BKA61DRAFT_553648 [Leptodontidium sp. MPI-SDFR-AT-0119]KAH9219841.1 hypothetical protein DL95DRAFT_443223 [Leptodontidium sp. 2 PMI_412]
MLYPTSSSDKNAVTSEVVAAAIPAPTQGSGSWSVQAKVHINASPAAVLSAIRNTNDWSKWSSFLPGGEISPKSPAPGPSSVDIPTGIPGYLELGSIVKTITSMAEDGSKVEGKGREQAIEVTVLKQLDGGKGGLLIAWKSTGLTMIKIERAFELVDDGNGGCDYHSWETFGGMLAGAAKKKVADVLAVRFGDYAKDLKTFVELK